MATTFAIATSASEGSDLLPGTRSRDSDRHPLGSTRGGFLYNGTKDKLHAFIASGTQGSGNTGAGCIAMAPLTPKPFAILRSGGETRCNFLVDLAPLPIIEDIRVYALNQERKDHYASHMSTPQGTRVLSFEPSASELVIGIE